MTNRWQNLQRVVIMLLLSVSTSGCNAQQRQAGMAQKEDALRGTALSGASYTWHMKKAELKTMTGWDAMPQWNIPAKPQHEVVAMTMLIPTAWQFQGGVYGQKDCNFTQGRVAFVATSADKTVGMISWPHPVSIWSNDSSVLQQVEADNRQFAAIQNCRIQQPKPLAQEMPDLVQEFAKALGGKVHAVGPMEPVPGIADKLKAAVDQANRQLASQGAQITLEVGRVPVRSDDAGDTGQGFLTVMQQIRSTRLPSGATVWTIDYPLQVATFAPQGKYASMESMFTAMLDSIHLDPGYQQDAMQVSINIQSIKQQTKQRLNQIAAQMQLDNLNAARQQAAIRQDAQNYASHVYSSVAAHRSAALEHSSQQFSLYMGDQAQYHDPAAGGTVQLPSGANHVWASQTGNTNEYILTNSASYNPNGNAGSSAWSEMKEIH